MDFPAYELREVPVTRQMADALGAAPLAAYMGRDLMCVLESETDVKKLSPDLEKAKDLPGLLLHATAPGSETDCVSRTFAPKCGVPEDPVCGSGHCHIAPYWTARLQKPRITAYQASVRGGTLYCAVEGGRVKLSGKAGAVCRIGNLPRLTGRFCGWVLGRFCDQFWAGAAAGFEPVQQPAFHGGAGFPVFSDVLCTRRTDIYIPGAGSGKPKTGPGRRMVRPEGLSC